MRIAWFDTHDSPWTTGDGWDYLREQGLDIVRCRTVEQVRETLNGSCAALVVAQEVSGAIELLTEIRTHFNSMPTMLISGAWGKSDFHAHAKTPGAAHRYARTPMPPEGFLDVLCGLLKTTRQELKLSSAAPITGAIGSFGISENAKNNSSQEVETLKKYLQMREEELVQVQGKYSELDSEFKRCAEEAAQKDKEARVVLQKSEDQERRIKTLEDRIFGLERDLIIEKENCELVVKTEREKFRVLEAELVEAKDRHESLKTRVRKDLRKIRVRERDLESKLELLRTDSDRMVESRDSKVLELQRKIDALEFDLDQIQDSRHKALTQSERYLAKLARVSRTLQLATSLLEDGNQQNKDDQGDDKTLLGGATEGLEDISKLLSEAEAAVAEKAEPVAAHTANATEDDDSAALTAVDTPSFSAGANADELLASLDSESDGDTGGTPSVSKGFSSPSLESLATDGDATRVVSRPPEESRSMGKLDLASDIDEAG